MTAYLPNPDLDLVLERTVDVAPELVWRAWTTPELLVQWFAPRPWSTTSCEIDLRPGGRFNTTMRSPEGEEYPSTGCILLVEEGSTLVFTSGLGPGFRPQIAGDGFPFTAIISIEPDGSGTGTPPPPCTPTPRRRRRTRRWASSRAGARRSSSSSRSRSLSDAPGAGGTPHRYRCCPAVPVRRVRRCGPPSRVRGMRGTGQKPRRNSTPAATRPISTRVTNSRSLIRPTIRRPTHAPTRVAGVSARP